MSNLNIDLIKKTLQQNKHFKLSKKQIAATLLAATMFVSAGSVTASAAEVKFDSITISQDGSIKEQNYTSSYLSERDAREVRATIANIDADYQVFTDLIANGAFYGYTMDVNACVARLIATINQIEAKYELQMKNNNLSSSAKNAINKYLQTKNAETRAAFSSVTSISFDQVKEFEKEYDYTFATTINGSTEPSIMIYKKGNSYAERAVTFNDSNLTNDKSLVVIPTAEVYTNNNRVSYSTKYQGVIVSRESVAMIRQIMQEADTLYDKMEAALDRGNYTKKYNETMDDIYVSLNGDLNLISSSLQTKYAQNPEVMNTVGLYMAYRSTMMTVKAYNNNRSRVSYADFVNYAGMNSPIRSHEENGYVYYNIGSYTGLYRVADKGYIKTTDLSATGSIINNIVPSTPNYNNGVIQTTVHTGLNIYYNDYPFLPVDVNGNQVYPFVYNGTTYLPVRAVAGLCNYNVEWNQSTNSVYLTRQESYTQTPVSYNGNFAKSQLVETVLQGTTNIRVFIDGVELIPRDANGQVVPVINWNGTTYLPVRALANQVGLAVNYDSENQIVFLGQHYTNNYNQTITPVTPNTPNINVTPGTGAVVGETREYIYGTKDGVEYKIYFDDNGFYLYDGANYVPVNVEEFSFGRTR